MRKGHAQAKAVLTNEVETEGRGGSGRLSAKNTGLVLVSRGSTEVVVQTSAGKSWDRSQTNRPGGAAASLASQSCFARARATLQACTVAEKRARLHFLTALCPHYPCQRGQFSG